MKTNRAGVGSSSLFVVLLIAGAGITSPATAQQSARPAEQIAGVLFGAGSTWAFASETADVCSQVKVR